jgi:DNA-binding protein H-NS
MLGNNNLYPDQTEGKSMASYTELMAQAQSLMAQAEQARKSEMTEVLAGIKSQMKQYGITAADLGGAPGAKSSKSKSSAPAKFRGPNGELWAGGPGRKPEWVRAVLTSGKSIEEFRI